MNWSCLAGWQPISRGDLKEMVRESIANEPKERKRLWNAIDEFDNRAKGVSDTKHRVKIMKEVAEKYGYNEEYFMEKINL